MKYLIPILLLALTLGMGGNCNGGGGGGGGSLCQTQVDVTFQVTDLCNGVPVILDRFSITYPNGTQIEIQASPLDPPGVYRVPQMWRCDLHSISATSAGYESYVDAEIRPYENFVAASMTPIGGCPTP